MYDNRLYREIPLRFKLTPGESDYIQLDRTKDKYSIDKYTDSQRLELRKLIV